MLFDESSCRLDVIARAGSHKIFHESIMQQLIVVVIKDTNFSSVKKRAC